MEISIHVDFLGDERKKEIKKKKETIIRQVINSWNRDDDSLFSDYSFQIKLLFFGIFVFFAVSAFAGTSGIDHRSCFLKVLE
jgi:hypothetical protein